MGTDTGRGYQEGFQCGSGRGLVELIEDLLRSKGGSIVIRVHGENISLHHDNYRSQTFRSCGQLTLRETLHELLEEPPNEDEIEWLTS